MASRVDLKGIKDQLKSIFETANTTTASPIDLSSDLTKRIQKVLTVHPQMIPIQASFYPCVTCYIDAKDIKSDDVASSQLNSKRKATIPIQVIGSVWNQNMTSVTEDPADNDINYLMENVELILRSNHNLNNKVLWQIPSNVRYYIGSIDEQTHLRAGILTLNATVYY